MNALSQSGLQAPAAIVGCACRLRGVEGPDALRLALERQEVERFITTVPEARWDWRSFHSERPFVKGRTTSRYGGFLEDLDRVDAERFGLSPRDLGALDPQHYLALETAWRAVESAGYTPESLCGLRGGVWACVTSQDALMARGTLPAQIELASLVGHTPMMAANRVSRALGLKGPSMAVDTGQSSGLVALHLARQSLLLGEVDLAVVVGANVVLSPHVSIGFSSAGLQSAQGRCASFSEGADGFVRAEGAVALVLKRGAEAAENRDPIWALVRGSATNHVGHSDAPLTNPDTDAQAEVVRRAAETSGISLGDVDYMEAHGSGTPSGDPIEFSALARAFAEQGAAPGQCALGSIKSTVGHLEGAAGLAGALAASLVVREKALYPLASLTSPRRALLLEESPFYLVDRPRPLRPVEREHRFACVHSIGLGGTNACVLLSDAPLDAAEVKRSATRPSRLSRTARLSLPKFEAHAPQGDRAGATPVETSCAPQDVASVVLDVIAQALNTSPQALDLRRPLTELGVDSLTNNMITEALSRRFEGGVPATLLFEHSTVEGLIEGLESRDLCPPAAPQIESNEDPDDGGAIAVLGIALRFPGARTPEEFWRNLEAGVDLVGEVPPSRWRAEEHFDPNPNHRGKSYSKWGGFLSELEYFDPLFFRISPKEAEWMDPQQRILLELAWEALERAGYGGGQLKGSNAAVHIAASYNHYREQRRHLPENAHSGVGNSNGVLANRISYFLDFKGPSLTIDTMCSSSLVALHSAIVGLRQGEYDHALVGAVHAGLSASYYERYSRIRALSPRGRCRAFDAEADGYVPGEGAAMLLLKPLAKARADGDRIDVVIRGSAVLHGGTVSGLTVPSVPAQADLLKRAHADAGVSAESFDYVEAHGTGTRLGDPVEVAGLNRAFGDAPKQFCGLGSVKSNIGHLEPAAGLAGLIKVALCMREERLVPTLHVESPNPKIHFEQTPFYPVVRPRPWPRRARPRLAGVSAFGIGGTIAHAVLEEPPQGPSPKAQREEVEALVLSARSLDALKNLARRYTQTLSASGSLRDIAATAAVGRTHFNHRLAFVGADQGAARASLNEWLEGKETGSVLRSENARVDRVALCLGEKIALEHPALLRLYEQDERFARAVDEDAALLESRLGPGWLPYLQGGRASPESPEAAAAALIVQWAVAQRLLQTNIELCALSGQGDGELAACVIANALSKEEALSLLLQRFRIRFGPETIVGARAQRPLYLASQGELQVGDPIPEVSRLATERGTPRFEASAPQLLLSLGANKPQDELQEAIWLPLFADPARRQARGDFERALARLYVEGVEVDWSEHHAGRPSVKVELPTYPFERRRCWIEVDRAPGERRPRDKTAELLFQSRWLPTASESGAPASGVWLVIDRGEAEGDRLQARLQEDGAQVLRARMSGPFMEQGRGVYQLDPSIPADFERLLTVVERDRAQDKLQGICVLFAGPDEHQDSDELLEAAELEALGLLSLTRAARRVLAPQGRLLVITRNAQAVEGAAPSLRHAPLLGLLRAASHELKQAQVLSVDFDSATSATELVQSIWAECTNARSEDVEVAYRGGRRLVERLEHAAMGTQRPPFKPDAGYVVVGGLGGVGFEICKRMGRDCGRLLVVGRTPQAELQEETAERLAALRALKAEVFYEACDLSSRASVEALAERTKATIGAPAGVVHAAGVMEPVASLSRKSFDEFLSPFAAKVNGSWWLARAFARFDLDFLVLFSSFASRFGRVSAGLAGYAAANRFQNQLAARLRAKGQPALALVWGAWDKLGMMSRGSLSSEVDGFKNLQPEAAVEAFCKCVQNLNAPWSELVVVDASPEAIDRAQKQARSLSASPAPVKAAGDRPSTESRLSGLLAEVLGMDVRDVSPRSTFIDLGMDSLLMADFVRKLEGETGEPMQPAALLEHSSVALLAEHLGDRLGSRPEVCATPVAPEPVRLLENHERLADGRLHFWTRFADAPSPEFLEPGRGLLAGFTWLQLLREAGELAQDRRFKALRGVHFLDVAPSNLSVVEGWLEPDGRGRLNAQRCIARADFDHRSGTPTALESAPRDEAVADRLRGRFASVRPKNGVQLRWAGLQDGAVFAGLRASEAGPIGWPDLLECAVLAGVSSATGEQEDLRWVPTTLGAVEFYEPPQHSATIRCRCTAQPEGLRLEIVLCGEDGQPLMEVSELRLRAQRRNGTW